MAIRGIAYYAFDTASTDRKPTHRYWSEVYRAHFYTISESEKASVDADSNWEYEGIEWYAYEAAGTANTKPLYRFYSGSFQAHFFTDSESEKAATEADTNWAFEGVGYYVAR